MNHRSKIPALALLGLSFTHCTGRESPGDSIVGDWRAIQIDGDKYPEIDTSYGQHITHGTQLRIDPDHSGELALYYDQSDPDREGLNERAEALADLVVDSSAAPKFRIEVAHDFFDDSGDYSEPGTSAPGTGYDDSGYDDSGAPETTSEGDDSGALQPARLRPRTVSLSPGLAPAAMVHLCTLDQDIQTSDLEDDASRKPRESSRIETEDA